MNRIDLTKTQIVDPPIEIEISNDGKNWHRKNIVAILPINKNKRFICETRYNEEELFTWRYARHIQTKIKVPDNIHIYLPRRDKCIILFNNDKQRLAVDNEGIYSVHKNTETTKEFAQLIPADKDNLEVGCGYYFVCNGYKFKYIGDLSHYGIYDGECLIRISHGLPNRLSGHDEKGIELYKIIPDEGV